MSNSYPRKIDFPFVLILFVSSLVTLIIRSDGYDPINLPKFQFFSIATITLAMYFLVTKVRIDLKKFKVVLISLIAFIVALLVSVIGSGTIYKGLIGTYGRNLGMLTYSLFALLMLLTALRAKRENIEYALYSLFLLGAIETSYGVLQHLGLDPIDWRNPYSPIIGSFGNPNYMSAFLGVTAITSLYFFSKSKNIFIRAASLLQILVSVWLIQASSSSQGLLAIYLGAGLFVVSLFEKNRLAKNLSGTIFLVGLLLGIIGILNRGPLSFVYQSSISARGDYWRAALSMFKSNPIVGVGLERYGDYFGIHRDMQQVTLRGYGTFSDNAHNVFLQFLSTGGAFLFLAYLVVISIVASYSIRIFRRNNDDFKSRAIVSTWVGALAISLLSPENIGFTIWSWVLGGLIIGLCKNEEDGEIVTKLSYRKKAAKAQFSTLRVTMVGVLLLLTFPITLFVTNSYKSDGDVYLAYRLARSQQTTVTQVSQFLGESISKSPNEEKYVALAGNLYLSIQEYEKGVMKGIELENLNSNSQDALKLQAYGYEKLNQLSKAIDARVRLTKIDPLGLGNLSDLVLDYGLNKDFSNAEKVLNRMKKIDPRHELILSVEESLKNMQP